MSPGRGSPGVVVSGPEVLTAAEDTRAWGRALAERLRPGDVVLLTGELGAGKTTLTQGLGEGLGVRGPVTSPTFVIAREHPSLGGGPALVHVDAYRLSGHLELDDLDLVTGLDEAVVVVEWGRGLAEELAESYLEVELVRAGGADAADTADASDADASDADASDAADVLDARGRGAGDLDGEDTVDPRTVRLVGHGPRWGDRAVGTKSALA